MWARASWTKYYNVIGYPREQHWVNLPARDFPLCPARKWCSFCHTSLNLFGQDGWILKSLLLNVLNIDLEKETLTNNQPSWPQAWSMTQKLRAHREKGGHVTSTRPHIFGSRLECQEVGIHLSHLSEALLPWILFYSMYKCWNRMKEPLFYKLAILSGK